MMSLEQERQAGGKREVSVYLNFFALCYIRYIRNQSMVGIPTRIEERPLYELTTFTNPRVVSWVTLGVLSDGGMCLWVFVYETR